MTSASLQNRSVFVTIFLSLQLQTGALGHHPTVNQDNNAVTSSSSFNASRLEVLRNPNSFLAENQRRLRNGQPFNFSGMSVDDLEKLLLGPEPITTTTPKPVTSRLGDPSSDIQLIARALSSANSRTTPIPTDHHDHAQGQPDPGLPNGPQGTVSRDGVASTLDHQTSGRQFAPSSVTVVTGEEGSGAESQRQDHLLQALDALGRRLQDNDPASQGTTSSELNGRPQPSPTTPNHAPPEAPQDAFTRHLHNDIEDLRTRFAQVEAEVAKVKEERMNYALELERLISRVQRAEAQAAFLNSSHNALREELSRARDARKTIFQRLNDVTRNVTMMEVSIKHMEMDFGLGLVVLGGNLTALEANLTKVNNSLKDSVTGVKVEMLQMQQSSAEVTKSVKNLTVATTVLVNRIKDLRRQRCENGNERLAQIPFDASKWPLSRHVTYAQPFTQAPSVHIGITGLQSDRGYSTGLLCTANQPSATGFTVTCEINTAVSRIYSIHVSWLACLI